MTSFVAMLRAVNLAGSTTMPSAELRAIGEACGFASVRTFIASGNLLFDSEEDEATVMARVAAGAEAFFGRAVPIFVRSGAEMAAVAAGNPFADRPGNRVVAHFIGEAPTQAMIDAATGMKDERIVLGTRELYIAYGDYMGHSKLKLPVFAKGTARNLNSVAKMAALLA